jgi:antitoxin component YwqK of YwqJK toxin-antitoxin module
MIPKINRKILLIVFLTIILYSYSCNKHDFECKYYDIKGNRISEIEFRLRGENGIVKVYYMGENGVKFIDEFEYKNKKKHGKWISWNDSEGYKNKEGVYKNGLKHGNEIWFYKNGRKLAEMGYKNDKLDGKCLGYYDNGKKFIEENYKDGEKHGKYICWDDSGAVLSEEIYQEGKLVKKIK